MTDRHPDDSHLDAAIDRAVREMMSVEPRADLRQRVMAELAEEPARTTLWPRLAFGSAALAVLLVLMFLFVKRPPDRAVEQTIVRSQSPASAPGSTRGATGPATGTAPKTADSGPPHATGPLAGTFTRRPGVPVGDERQVQAASIDTDEPIGIEPMTPVERLAPIDPIGIAPLEAATVSTLEISIKPITIARIEIRPLTPPR
jgi:hypothetical protein